jgi:hypothetical protein
MNIAGDPYAAAKFFHFVIVALLEELFGIKAYSNGSQIKQKDGLFGKVAFYISMVKVQGQGTLHLHIIVWLMDALTHVEMKEALKMEAFRAKVMAYIAANIQADLDGAEKDAVLCMPKQTAVSYSHPVDPNQLGYVLAAKIAERTLVRSIQHHTCDKNTCLISKKRHHMLQMVCTF